MALNFDTGLMGPEPENNPTFEQHFISAAERYAESHTTPKKLCQATRKRAWVDSIVGDTCNAVLVDGWQCPFFQDHTEA